MLPAEPVENSLKIELPQNPRDAENLAGVKPGDVLTGRVIRDSTPRGGGLARFSGHNIPLAGIPDLAVGQRVSAEVVKVAYQVFLKVLPGENPSHPGPIPYSRPVPGLGNGKAVTAVLNLPGDLKSGNVLTLAKPGDIISGVVVKDLGTHQSIIQIDGLDIPASSSQRLREGQSVTARIERTLPQLTLKILREVQGKTQEPSPPREPPLPSAEITIRLHRNPLKGNSPVLREGQLTELKILQVVSGGRGLVEIAGKQAEASLPRGLMPGDSLPMLVDSVEPEPMLKSVNPSRAFNTEKAAAYIREFLPAKEPLENILSRLTKMVSEAELPDALRSEKGLLDGLRQALRDSVLVRPESASPELLQRAANVSGQNYEANLKAALELGVAPEEIRKVLLKGDLKGELLRLGNAVDAKLSALREGAPHSPAQVRELQNFGNALRSATHQIELNQIMNAVNQREGNTVFFQVPYIAGDGGVKTAQVYVQKPGKDKRPGRGEKKEAYHVTILLDMSALGSLRADVHLLKNSLHCKIVSHKSEAKAFIEGHLPGLEAGLKGLGFSANLECRMVQKEKVRAPVHLKKASVEKLGILDVKV